jgi:hypothetical protein
MIKVQLECANKILDGKSVFGNRMLSCKNNFLVIQDDRNEYYGTKLRSGKLIADAGGYVIFKRVEPVITEATAWKFF